MLVVCISAHPSHRAGKPCTLVWGTRLALAYRVREEQRAFNKFLPVCWSYAYLPIRTTEQENPVPLYGGLDLHWRIEEGRSKRPFNIFALPVCWPYAYLPIRTTEHENSVPLYGGLDLH